MGAIDIMRNNFLPYVFTTEITQIKNVHFLISTLVNSVRLVKHERYNPALSNNYRRGNQPFQITYGSGAVKGFTSFDTVTVS